MRIRRSCSWRSSHTPSTRARLRQASPRTTWGTNGRRHDGCRTTTAGGLTAAGASAGSSTVPIRGLRALIVGLIRHLHAFALEESLTEAEWLAGIRFLTEVGQMCSDRRQEFMLLSDTLGLSMLVDLINHASGSGATEVDRARSVLRRGLARGDPTVTRSPMTWETNRSWSAVVSWTPQARPLPGATVDVWQNAPNRLYAVQDETQSPENLRGRFRTGADGAFAFRTVRPVDYPIPDDGPVGRMLRRNRPPSLEARAHPLRRVRRRIRPVTTHVFDSESPYLQSDAVFGVKESLVRKFDRARRARGACTRRNQRDAGTRLISTSCCSPKLSHCRAVVRPMDPVAQRSGSR